MARPAMLVVKTPAREGNRSKPCMQQVASAVRTTPADRAPLPDCVPKLPLRHRTAGRIDARCPTAVR